MLETIGASNTGQTIVRANQKVNGFANQTNSWSKRHPGRCSGESEFGKKIGLGAADPCGGRGNLPFRAADVRPTPQQLGRQSDGDLGRQGRQRPWLFQSALNSFGCRARRMESACIARRAPASIGGIVDAVVATCAAARVSSNRLDNPALFEIGPVPARWFGSPDSPGPRRAVVECRAIPDSYAPILKRV